MKLLQQIVNRPQFEYQPFYQYNSRRSIFYSRCFLINQLSIANRASSSTTSYIAVHDFLTCIHYYQKCMYNCIIMLEIKCAKGFVNRQLASQLIKYMQSVWQMFVAFQIVATYIATKHTRYVHYSIPQKQHQLYVASYQSIGQVLTRPCTYI